MGQRPVEGIQKEPKPKILVVDDEPKVLQLTKLMLEPYAYEVLTATNGEEALRIARSQRIDLMLLDLSMPVMDGFEVLLRLKADQATIGIPVVIVTAKEDTSSILHAQALLARDYLVKPFEFKVLLRTVTRYVKAPSGVEDGGGGS